MADSGWGGVNIVQRAFDRFRPSRIRKLAQRHDAPGRPIQPSEQPSGPHGHRPATRTVAQFAGKATNRSTNRSSPQTNSEIVGNGFSEAKPADTLNLPLADKPSTKAYVVSTGSETPSFTDGPSRIVMTSDGTKGCLALLLTRGMVNDLNEVLSGTRKVNKLEYEVDDLGREITHAAIDLEFFLADIEALSGSADKTVKEAKIKEDMKNAEERSQQAASRKKPLEESLHWEKRNLEYSHDKTQEVFQRVLSESRLLQVDEESAETGERALKSVYNTGPGRSEAPTRSLETMISVEELNRRVTYEEVETRREHFHSLNDEFENREAFYDSEFREYQEAVEDGSCVLPQSEFDRIFIRNISRLTRALISAETAYENALARARALKIVGNEFEQESDFVDYEDDGYRASYEADMAAGVDRYFIDRWIEVTEESENQEEDPPIDETDEWDARAIEISDSISMVAEGRSRVRIDRWRETVACRTSS